MTLIACTEVEYAVRSSSCVTWFVDTNTAYTTNVYANAGDGSVTLCASLLCMVYVHKNCYGRFSPEQRRIFDVTGTAVICIPSINKTRTKLSIQRKNLWKCFCRRRRWIVRQSLWVGRCTSSRALPWSLFVRWTVLAAWMRPSRSTRHILRPCSDTCRYGSYASVQYNSTVYRIGICFNCVDSSMIGLDRSHRNKSKLHKTRSTTCPITLFNTRA